MLDFAFHVGKKAGAYLLENLGSDLQVEHKGRIDLVTRVDKKAQEIIICEIENEYSEHSIIAEEGVKKSKSGQYVWYIDPLDGTVNFVHGIPIFCVSIALYVDNMPHIGVCYNPVLEEIFWAQADKGAYLNNSPIKVSNTEILVDSLVVTGFPYSTHKIESLTSRFSRVLHKVQGIRRLGSAALDLCYVACGRFDGFWEEGLHSWDMAAGIVILLEAGGKVSGFNGSDFDLTQGEIIASNNRIHNELTQLM
jgi:myo-inositol-1(or 4)-monophosphatase